MVRNPRSSPRRLLLGLIAVIVLVAVSACTQAAPPAADPAAVDKATPVAAAAPAAAAPAAAAPTAMAPASAAATSQAAAPAPAAPTAVPIAAARKPQGTLVVGLTNIGRGALGLPSRQDSDAAYAGANIMEFLLRVDATGKLIPGLAEKWAVSPDGTKITFNLRKGVQFHDNWGELTADDVKFSYQDMIQDGSTSMGKIAMMRFAKSADVVDKYTVVFNVAPGDLLMVLGAGVATTPTPQFPIISKKYVESVGLDKAGATPIGTGPWKFVSHKAGDSITLEAVENHWRQTPYFKTLILREVPQLPSMVAMLRAGDVDIAVVAPDYRKELESSGVRVVASTPGIFAHLGLGGMYDPSHKNFNPKIPWVGDPTDATSAGNALKVRKALNTAINRKQLADAILGGGTPSSVTPYLPGTPFYDGAWDFGYDPARAKQLLKEAGYPDGFAFEMLVLNQSGRPWMPDLMEAVAMQWEQNLGVKVKRTPVEIATTNPLHRDRTLGQTVFARGFSTFTEPQFVMNSVGRTNSPQTSAAESKAIDAMLDGMAKEYDDGKRTALIRKFGQYRFENALDLPIGDVPMLIAVGKKVAAYPSIFASSSLREFEYATPR